MEDIRAVLERVGEWTHGGDVEGVAEEWVRAGFNATEVEGWLWANCYDPSAAKALRDLGLSPIHCAVTISIGGVDNTVAYWVSNGDLSLKDAFRLAWGEDSESVTSV